MFKLATHKSFLILGFFTFSNLTFAFPSMLTHIPNAPFWFTKLNTLYTHNNEYVHGSIHVTLVYLPMFTLRSKIFVILCLLKVNLVNF